jgi:hypothetical protein
MPGLAKSRATESRCQGIDDGLHTHYRIREYRLARREHKRLLKRASLNERTSMGAVGLGLYSLRCSALRCRTWGTWMLGSVEKNGGEAWRALQCDSESKQAGLAAQQLSAIPACSW